jgi:hypothetical protein
MSIAEDGATPRHHPGDCPVRLFRLLRMGQNRRSLSRSDGTKRPSCLKGCYTGSYPSSPWACADWIQRSPLLSRRFARGQLGTPHQGVRMSLVSPNEVGVYLFKGSRENAPAPDKVSKTWQGSETIRRTTRAQYLLKNPSRNG